jgi:hypothetical protein
VGSSSTLTFGADCFNVFGSQRPVTVDQSYVSPVGKEVLPIPGGTMADLPGKVLTTDHQPLPLSNVNSNFGRVTAYQPARTIRFLARLRF